MNVNFAWAHEQYSYFAVQTLHLTYFSLEKVLP